MGKAAAAERQAAVAVGGAADQHPAPWFTPEPKPEAGRDGDAGRDDGAPAGWFLPAGRAGLLPESMTVSWDDEPRNDPAARAAAASAPPWAGDVAVSAAGEPPPWENGPWPGPGEREPDLRDASPAGAQRPEPAWSGVQQAAVPRRTRRLLLAAGAAVVVVTAIAMVIVLGMSGGSGGGCGTYPPAVRRAYATAMGDLSRRAPAAVQAADLAHAASLANASAASAGQLTVRTALFAMAGDLVEAHADVIAYRPVSPALLQRLTADGTALPASCPG